MTPRLTCQLCGIALLALALAVLLSARGNAALQRVARQPKRDHLKVVVSVAPLKGLVSPLLPAGTPVELLIPAGVSEHGYEIPTGKLTALAKADMVVTVGLGLEPQVTRFLTSNPRQGREHVEFAAAIDRHIKPEDKHDHDHDHDQAPGADDHKHSAGDPHVWLDPRLARELIDPLVAAIKGARDARGLKTPDDKSLVDAANAMRLELDKLDADYTRRLVGCPGKTIVTAHDAYGWLAKRYGLRCVPLSGLTAGEPTPGTIQAASRVIKEQNVKAVFFEPQLSAATGRRLADAAGVQLLTLDPLGNGDYFLMMRRNLDALVKGLGGPDEAPASAPGSAPKSTDSQPPSRQDK